MTTSVETSGPSTATGYTLANPHTRYRAETLLAVVLRHFSRTRDAMTACVQDPDDADDLMRERGVLLYLLRAEIGLSATESARFLHLSDARFAQAWQRVADDIGRGVWLTMSDLIELSDRLARREAGERAHEIKRRDPVAYERGCRIAAVKRHRAILARAWRIERPERTIPVLLPSPDDSRVAADASACTRPGTREVAS